MRKRERGGEGRRREKKDVVGRGERDAAGVVEMNKMCLKRREENSPEGPGTAIMLMILSSPSLPPPSPLPTALSLPFPFPSFLSSPPLSFLLSPPHPLQVTSLSNSPCLPTYPYLTLTLFSLSFPSLLPVTLPFLPPFLIPSLLTFSKIKRLFLSSYLRLPRIKETPYNYPHLHKFPLNFGNEPSRPVFSHLIFERVYKRVWERWVLSV